MVKKLAKRIVQKSRQKRWNQQRIDHGYSDFDWYSFDHFLATIVSDAAKRFREEGKTTPGGMTKDRWDEELLKIEVGFKAYTDLLEDFPDKDKREELYTVFDIGMRAFVKNFARLWD